MEKTEPLPDKSKLVFFLGGYDAEMVTIKEILEEKKNSFYDNKLHWGAKLSEYLDEISKLTKEQIPIFIELNLDIDYPSNAIIIDHHNERAGKDKKTSIEQVADLLGVELNRWQQLICANDKGYIWGMIDFGATGEEIKNIRELDKEKQGVTIEDEEKAKISVEHFLERISNDAVIIYSQTEKTSAVTDLIYKFYRHIFLITPSKKLNYSGTKQIIDILRNRYAELKKEDIKIEIWFGGYLPDHGYFGSDKALTKSEIIKIMEPFIEKERIHSQHIFMFPFTIETEEVKESRSSKERLKKIHERLKDSSWEYKPFKISLIHEGTKQNPSEKRTIPYSPDETWAYNEYNYFYECVRDTLFNQTDGGKLFDEKYEHPISLYYERESLPNDEMIIYIKSKPEPYRLRVNHLSLRIFETGIGILSLTLYNYCYSEFQDVLFINDFGRRIYPQFFGEQDDKNEPVEKTKETFLPDKIESVN